MTKGAQIHTGSPSTVLDDEHARVDGRVRFAADVPAHGLLHAAFVGSSEPHARLRAVDVDDARALPGVAAVLTGADIGDRRFGRRVRDYPVLAVDRVRFVGQRIAAVAAEDPDTARAAAEMIRVEYEPLPAILDPRAAIAPGADPVHPRYAEYDGAHEHRSVPNVQGEDVRGRGDADAGLAASDEIHRHRFSWARSHSAPLEPHTCLVAAGSTVHVHAAHKEPYKLRTDLARLADRDPHDVVVHAVSIGGDFGAKGAPFLEGICYFLSVATGRPIRAVLSYLEELTSMSARHPGDMELITGLRDGRLHAHDATALLDGGAFAAAKPQPKTVIGILGVATHPYDIPHRRERSLSVYTHTLPGGQVRSPGEFQAAFAGESHVDLIARERGEDPLDFRLRQAAVPEARKVLEPLVDVVSDWRRDLGPDEGVGVAVFHRGSGAGESRVRCHANADGVEILVGAPDQGAGSYPAFRQLAARELGVPLPRVHVRATGADPSLADSGAGASRVTSVAGRACVEACREVLATLGARPDADGEYWIAGRLDELGRGDVSAEGTWTVTRDQPRPTAPTHGSLAVQVAVDTATGVYRVVRAHLVVDAGLVVNPVGHRGQLEGGFVYGLGQACFEDLTVDGGQVTAATLGDYKIPSASDIPPLTIELLKPDPDEDPLEAIRPVGELANLGVAPAIANAIDDAVGVRVTHLPITPERVWRGLRNGKGRD